MPRIMIVDDDASIQMEMEEYLTHMGYSIVGTADTSAGAVEMAREMKPDLILMDIVLSGEIDGISAAQKIKAESDIPIVFITGYGDPECIEKVQEIEPFGYVMKPFDDEEIGAVIEIALHKKAIELKLEKANEQLAQANRDLKQEIKKRKRTEEVLIESELWMQSIFNSLEEAVFVVTLDRKWANINKSAQSMFGYSKDELTNRSTGVLHVDHEHYIEFGRRIKEAFDRKEAANFEFKAKRKNGEVFPSEHTVSLLERNVGEPIGMVSVVRDLSDRKKAEEALQRAHDELEQHVRERTADLQKANKELADEIEVRTQTEKKLNETKNTLNSILSSATEYAIVATDLGFRIHHHNSAAERLFGCKAEEVLGRTVQKSRIMEKVLPERFENAIKEAIEHGKYEYNSIDQDPTGAKRFVRKVIMPMHDEKGDTIGYTFFAKDVTKTRELQAQVVRSERLAATGQLASSIAHEVNSPLQAITFVLNMMKKKLKNEEELMESIRILQEAFQGIRGTVKNLLDLNRPGKNLKQQTDVNCVINKTIDLVRIQLKKDGVKITSDLSSGIPNFNASPQQLTQLFLNLFNNAAEAMIGESKSKQGGTGGTSGRRINIKTNLGKGYVEIKVADNGPGISEGDLNHIFDSFYTRKKNMGLGIGLSVCHDIVKDHGGTIQAGNGSEGGAVFTMTLPLD